MSLFQYDTDIVTEQLIPPQLRQPKTRAWLKVLIKPLKQAFALFLTDFCQGVNYPNYNNSATYSYTNRIIWQDGSVYELQVATSTGIPPTGNALSATNWLKIQENFIGVDERKYYSSQLIIFERAINKWFQVNSAPFIYFTAITPGSVSAFIEVNVPTAVYAALGPNNAARNQRIADFCLRYTIAGYQIAITTY